MKRFFTFLLFAIGAAPLLFSQVTMTKVSHGFISGQSHECQAVEYQSPGESGKNCVWDFSKVSFLDEEKSVASLSDESYGQGTIKADQNDGREFFFNITEYANEYWGYKTGNSVFQLTEPIIKAKYPQTYNTQFFGKFSGTVTMEGSNSKYKIEGTYSTHADGSGTIILPDGVSLTALRVKTTERYPNFERVKYLWYAQNVTLPLFISFEDFSIASDGTKNLRNAQSFLNTQVKKSFDTKSLSNNFDYQIFPNPFKDNIQLSYYLPENTVVTVELFTSGGSKLITLVSNQEQSGPQTISQDVSKYTQQPGVYLLKIIVGDKTYTEKLVKAY